MYFNHRNVELFDAQRFEVVGLLSIKPSLKIESASWGDSIRYRCSLLPSAVFATLHLAMQKQFLLPSDSQYSTVGQRT